MWVSNRRKLNHYFRKGGVLSFFVLNAGLPFRPEGIYGEGVLLRDVPRVRGAGEVALPGILLKRGDFGGFPGASPGLNLITLQHLKTHVTKAITRVWKNGRTQAQSYSHLL